jgi:hypothetical protein
MIQDPLPSSSHREVVHAVQLFDDVESLGVAAAAFLAVGWPAEHTLLVVATTAHWNAIAPRLEAHGVPVAEAIDSGRLVVRDARVTLDAFLRHECIDPDAFDATVGQLVRSLAAHGRPLRIFGEMVDLLACTGDYHGAEQLEGLWNRLAENQAFALFCGYSASTFGDPRSRDALRRICDTHEHVYSNPSDLLGSFLVDAAHAN